MRSTTKICRVIVTTIALAGYGSRSSADGENAHVGVAEVNQGLAADYTDLADGRQRLLAVVLEDARRANPLLTSAPDTYRVFFEFNQADITPAALSVLEALKTNADGAEVKRIVVSGHTSTIGSSDDNLRLSQWRAEAVKSMLLELTVRTRSIVTEAHGEADLLVPTVDGVSEPNNCRVELTLMR